MNTWRHIPRLHENASTGEIVDGHLGDQLDQVARHLEFGANHKTRVGRKEARVYILALERLERSAQRLDAQNAIVDLFVLLLRIGIVRDQDGKVPLDYICETGGIQLERDLYEIEIKYNVKNGESGGVVCDDDGTHPPSP